MNYRFQTWLERREPDQNEIKDALIGAIPEKIKSAAGVTGSNPEDAEILLGKPISAFSQSGGMVNAILQQGSIKNVLTPDAIDMIHQAVKADSNGQMTFRDLLGLILGQSPKGQQASQPKEDPALAPNGAPPPGQMPPSPQQVPAPAPPGSPMGM